jgi:hypothetical protein
VTRRRKDTATVAVAQYRLAQGLPAEAEPDPDPQPSVEFLRERTPLEELEREADLLRWNVQRLEQSRDWYRRAWQEARAEVLAPLAQRERLEATLETDAAWATLEGAEWCLA